ncbi:histone acetylation protein-domain-containing protein [Aspergillus cavernicola]|uniref:Ceramide glucosyltransferase n=1 Tax=Aspergillus cavernicola TaxID=176166 RepID=A0ABR4I9W1_9EURO
MSKVDVDLGDLLAKVLPTEVKVTIRHISSTPTASTTALFAPSPGEESEPTFCENHFLSASVTPPNDKDEDDGTEIIVFGIEVLVYTTAHLTTIFISKADSTGHLHLLKAMPKSSILRRITNTFLFFLVHTHQRPGVRLVVSLFARSQNQYLFPGSIENPEKHVLDDRGLIKWWCRALDPILREYEPESGSQEQDKKAEESAHSSATAYLIVPSCDKFETRGFFPSSAKSDDQRCPRWLNAYPLRQLCSNPDAPPRCLVPRFPDDPKTRFLVDLDDELSKRGGGRGDGQWRSVKSLDQFWEMMSFRQECSAGRLVGFLWLIINPPGLLNSNPMLSSKPGLTEVSSDSKSLESNESSSQHIDQTKLQSANDGSAFYWPQVGRGHAVLSEEDYKAAINFLLEQDFFNEEVSFASTNAFNDKVAALADELWIGQQVVGKNAAEESTSTPTPNTLINTVLVRKRKKDQDEAEASDKAPGASTESTKTTGLHTPMIKFNSSSFSGFGLATRPVQWSVAVGWIGLVWYTTVTTVCALGYYKLWKHYLQRPQKSHSATTPDAPHVTVIRPIKGLEPHLYDCLASAFRQEYPRDSLTICLCTSSRSDPAYPILEKLVTDFPRVDARILIEDEDPLLQPDHEPAYDLGPNPKIRNMSRAYREAKGDIVWIVDCNVWVGKGVCGRMVDALCGLGVGSSRGYKFVHHLPVAVDVATVAGSVEEQRVLETNRAAGGNDVKELNKPGPLAMGGGRLEELFLASSHAKMYTAINTVLIAPCIVGKSNMFRRSHLDYLTTPAPADPRRRNPGIDYFSDNICEDHLIGDLLWKNKVREEKEQGKRLGKHALVYGDLAFQPIADMSVQSYIARRVRWLRVRKYIVMLATLVEPGTESILCSLYGAWGVTTALARYLQDKGFDSAMDLSTWRTFFTFFGLSILTWSLIDRTVYIMLHSGKTVELDGNTPGFVRPPQGTTRRQFRHWLAAWLGRETLAFPIWFWAIWGGETVTWRDRRFRVGLDTKAHEIQSTQPMQTGGPLPPYSEDTALLSAAGQPQPRKPRKD